MVDRLIEIGRRDFRVTCLSLGNPHCVTFVERVDALDLQVIGPLFENAEIFPERVNAGFARVVNERMIKLRVYERGKRRNACLRHGRLRRRGAAVKLGKCPEGEDITVKLPGGDLIVRIERGRAYLTGETAQAFEGKIDTDPRASRAKKGPHLHSCGCGLRRSRVQFLPKEKEPFDRIILFQIVEVAMMMDDQLDGVPGVAGAKRIVDFLVQAMLLQRLFDKRLPPGLHELYLQIYIARERI